MKKLENNSELQFMENNLTDDILTEKPDYVEDYATFDCANCSDINDFLILTNIMVEEINFLRAEVVRWRQALIKYLSEEWADGLRQDILSNLYLYDYLDYNAYNFFINRCYNGQDPMFSKEQSKLLKRLIKGTDSTSITYL